MLEHEEESGFIIETSENEESLDNEILMYLKEENKYEIDENDIFEVTINKKRVLRNYYNKNIKYFTDYKFLVIIAILSVSYVIAGMLFTKYSVGGLKNYNYQLFSSGYFKSNFLYCINMQIQYVLDNKYIIKKELSQSNVKEELDNCINNLFYFENDINYFDYYISSDNKTQYILEYKNLYYNNICNVQPQINEPLCTTLLNGNLKYGLKNLQYYLYYLLKENNNMYNNNYNNPQITSELLEELKHIVGDLNTYIFYKIDTLVANGLLKVSSLISVITTFLITVLILYNLFIVILLLVNIYKKAKVLNTEVI